MIKPSRLYIAADGPRTDRDGETLKCNQAREIASEVDWPCKINTLFRDNNLGCKAAISEAISWFFNFEEEGIILEDDCVPHEDFFRFCAHGLEKYRNDSRVFAITGNNFQNGKMRGSASYYFSKYPHCWGWATWRRAWLNYDPELSFWDEWHRSVDWKTLNHDNREQHQWNQLAKKVQKNQLDSWAIPWMFSVWYRHGLTMTPNVNLVTNIGVGAEATHTVAAETKGLMLPISSMEIIVDSDNVVRDHEADRHVFINIFGGRNYYFLRHIISSLKVYFQSAGYRWRSNGR